MPCGCHKTKRVVADSRTASAAASQVTYTVKTATRTTTFKSLFEAQRYATAHNGKITTN